MTDRYANLYNNKIATSSDTINNNNNHNNYHHNTSNKNSYNIRKEALLTWVSNYHPLYSSSTALYYSLYYALADFTCINNTHVSHNTNKNKTNSNSSKKTTDNNMDEDEDDICDDNMSIDDDDDNNDSNGNSSSSNSNSTDDNSSQSSAISLSSSPSSSSSSPSSVHSNNSTSTYNPVIKEKVKSNPITATTTNTSKSTRITTNNSISTTSTSTTTITYQDDILAYIRLVLHSIYHLIETNQFRSPADILTVLAMPMMFCHTRHSSSTCNISSTNNTNNNSDSDSKICMELKKLEALSLLLIMNIFTKYPELISRSILRLCTHTFTNSTTTSSSSSSSSLIANNNNNTVMNTITVSTTATASDKEFSSESKERSLDLKEYSENGCIYIIEQILKSLLQSSQTNDNNIDNTDFENNDNTTSNNTTTATATNNNNSKTKNTATNNKNTKSNTNITNTLTNLEICLTKEILRNNTNRIVALSLNILPITEESQNLLLSFYQITSYTCFTTEIKNILSNRIKCINNENKVTEEIKNKTEGNNNMLKINVNKVKSGLKRKTK